MTKFILSFSLLGALLTVPAFSQQGDIKDTVLKHLKVSRDFTLKVAEAMPAKDYGFKLTDPQMSFAQQMVHLASGLDFFMAPFRGEKPNPGKPSSMDKPAVIAFVKEQYEKAISEVSGLTSEQMTKSYKTEENSTNTGFELLLAMLDHTTHHRASAEMYLRAKGITPPEYES